MAHASLTRWFPFLAWPRPSRALLRGEFWAGITVGLMLVPQGLESRLRKLFEHLEAVLLGIDEFDDA